MIGGGVIPNLIHNRAPFSLLTLARFASGGVSKRRGRSLLYGEGTDATGRRHPELPQSTPQDVPKKMNYIRYPPSIRNLGTGYHFRENKEKLSFFQFVDMGKKKDMCVVGSTNKADLTTKTLQSCVFSHSRGFTSQIILEGRGVRASFEPAWPMLKIRMGSGVKVMDVSRHIKRHAGQVKVSITPKGDAIIIHGYDKAAVAYTTIKLFCYVKQNPYTGKGGFIHGFPIKRKTSKKK